VIEMLGAPFSLISLNGEALELQNRGCDLRSAVHSEWAAGEAGVGRSLALVGLDSLAVRGLVRFESGERGEIGAVGKALQIDPQSHETATIR